MTVKGVLIVDDDEDICSNIKDILDDLGYRTDVAHGGAAALELVRAHSYDVALLDFSMPGMDGATLHEEIIRLQPEIAAIMVTAHAQSDGAQRAREGGIQPVLRKPVEMSVLLPLIEQMAQSPVVLVVDDDPEFSKTLWHLLRERSYRVCLAACKEEGLVRASDTDYQIALVDLSLRNGPTDGFEVLQRVNEANPSACTILITGNREEAEAVVGDLTAIGLNKICFKPLDMDALIALISERTD